MVVAGTLPRGFKTRPEQRAFRKKEVVRLLAEGCTPPQIAAAMRPQIGEAAVRDDARKAGVRWARRINRTAPDPPPVDWLNPPAAQEGPADRVAVAVARFLGEMEAARWEMAHAHNLLDARLHGGREWEEGWLDLIGQLRHLAAGLEQLHTDSGFLRATALGRVPPGRSEGVHEDGQGSRGVVQAVIHVVHEAGGPRGLGGDVEDDEDHERPAGNLPKHPSSVTLHWPARDGARV